MQRICRFGSLQQTHARGTNTKKQTRPERVQHVKAKPTAAHPGVTFSHFPAHISRLDWKRVPCVFRLLEWTLPFRKTSFAAPHHPCFCLISELVWSQSWPHHCYPAQPSDLAAQRVFCWSVSLAESRNRSCCIPP